MKILKIHIDGFGKLHDFDIEPGDGISVFFGCNEAGKSTLHLFIRSILYGASTRKKVGMKSVYDRMRPWQQPEIYRGRIVVEHEQQQYLIERDFNKAPDDLTIYEVGNSKKIEDPAALMQRLLGGLSETAYVNTVSSGQLGAATQRDMAVELRKYAANVSATMNPDLNSDKALQYLAEQKQKLQEEFDENAAKDYTATLSEIKKLETELVKPENDNKIGLYSDAIRRVKEDSEELSGRMQENETKLSQHKSQLKERGFGEESEIDRTAESVHNDYNSLKQQKKRAYSKLAILQVLVLIALAAFLVYMGLQNEPATNEWLMFMVAAALAVAWALIKGIRISDSRKNYKLAQEKLTTLIKKYVDVENVDDESISRFDTYIEESRDLSAKVDKISKKHVELDLEQKKLRDEREDYLNHLEIQQQTKSKVEEKLVRLNELRRQAMGLQRRIKANNVVTEKLEALELAEETLTDLASGIRNAAGTYINKEASALVSAFTGNAYNSISAGVNYDIQLNSPNGLISISDLSAGTADQVYLAIRLATIRFIAGENDPMPLILDDSFNLYDDERLEASLKFLEETYKGQILIFTCQDREEKMLQELGLSYKRLKM